MKTKRFNGNIIRILSSLQSFFKLTDEEKKIYYKEIFSENTRRVFYLSLMAIPVSIVHIILFSQKLEFVAGVERQWVKSIIYTHLSLLIVAIVSGVYLYFSIFRRKRNSKTSIVYTHVLLSFVLILGIALTAFDQFVTPAITPFLNTTILIGLFFQIRPTISVIYYTASYALYYFAISQTQLNQDMLISNQVNGISITAIGLCLSLILWHSRLTRILQQKQILQQNKALHDSNAQKDKFFSIIAHDLTNPFNSIKGFSDLILEQVEEKNYETVGEYAMIINQSVNSTMDLLRNLMDWSRAQTGMMEFKPGYFDLNGLVKETENLFAGALKQKKIFFTINTSGNTVIFADKNMIRTILCNLISNAIKFTHRDGHIVLSVLKQTNEYLISVSDDGVGIPPDTIEKLFLIDQNKSTRGTQNESGTGLGLLLCKELIEKHGGKIRVESEYGKGSTFNVSIPYNP
ncbi:MAG: ATP-binding protein [Bacteroidales bacterium]|nr:ATP-binding protein [Bacteroidales bacterium]